MSIPGPPASGPRRRGPPVSDLVAGLYAALGTVAALVRRERTGRGERVGAALVDGLLSLGAFMSAECLATGRLPERTGNDHALVAPYGLFPAADGEVAIAPSHDGVYFKLLAALGLEPLRDDPRFRTNALRVANRAAINAEIGARTRAHPRAHWIERLNAAGVPCGLVLNLAEAYADPQIASQEMVLAVEHPGRGTVRMTGFPIKFADAPCRVRHPAPALGAHTAEVLRAAGFDDAEIARLRREVS
jgi:crotonobetainyl-CoA:carnitine CoA-transferase CaiB-like acyl-CoA transferase